MWSDPIDELIAQFERMLGTASYARPDMDILKRVLRDAKHHRELENRTGKVGFEATNG